MSETEFAAQVTELQGLGLNAASLARIVQAGPDQGSSLAGRLIGGPDAIRHLNGMQRQIKAAAEAFRKERDTWT